MKKVVAAYSKLPLEVRKAINKEYEEDDPMYISFPHKGKITKGFIFPWDDVEYLVFDDGTSTSYTPVNNDDDDDTDDDDVDLKDDISMDDEDMDSSDDDDDDDYDQAEEEDDDED